MAAVSREFDGRAAAIGLAWRVAVVGGLVAFLVWVVT